MCIINMHMLPYPQVYDIITLITLKYMIYLIAKKKQFVNGKPNDKKQKKTFR